MKKEFGNKIKLNQKTWSFKNKTVVKNFENHVSESVPLYYESQDLILRIINFFISENSKIVDLGCSVGNFTYRLYDNLHEKNIRVIGIDESKDMISQAKQKYKAKNLKFISKDILKYDFGEADAIIANYTIQFIRPSVRQELINKIYSSLNWEVFFLCWRKFGLMMPDFKIYLRLPTLNIKEIKILKIMRF